MRLLFSTFLLTALTAYGGSAGDTTSEPDVVAKMTQGLVTSKVGDLTSSLGKDGDKEYSYHLQTISYLGTVSRDGKVFTIAATKFIRSSAKGSQYPPARGHSFLVVFDAKFAVVTHGRMDFADYHMEGEVLKLGDSVVIDFASIDPLVRHRGWMVDGGFMPYPFADRISDADWESGAFQK